MKKSNLTKKKFIIIIYLIIAFIVALCGFNFNKMNQFLLSTRLDIPVVTLFSILTAFLINRSMERIQLLKESAIKELHALRRCDHLLKFLLDEAKQNKQYNKYRDLFIKYHNKIIKNNFKNYHQASSEFREMTFSIYSLDPKIVNVNSQIYQELLNATRTVTYTRQEIRNILNRGMSKYIWSVYIFLLMILMTASFFATGYALNHILITFFIITSSLLMLDFLYELDNLSEEEYQSYTNMYIQNKNKIM